MKMEKIVKTYYDKLREGKIMGRKCLDCGVVEWPPHIGCNACGSRNVEWVEMSGKGKMIQMVMPSPITMKPEMDGIKPYCLAVVETEEGVAVNAMVRGVNKRNKAAVDAMMPAPVHAVIVDRGDYDTVIFELDVIPEGEARKKRKSAE